MMFNWIRFMMVFFMMMNLTIGTAATNKFIKKKIDRAPNGKLLKLYRS